MSSFRLHPDRAYTLCITSVTERERERARERESHVERVGIEMLTQQRPEKRVKKGMLRY